MTSLFVLIGGLFAVLVISSLLYYYRKYKSDVEGKLVEIKLLVNSAKEHQNHNSKQLLDIMKANKEDLFSNDRVLKEHLDKFKHATEQKFELSQKRMEDHIAAMEKRNELRLHALKESFETQLDVLRRGMIK